MCAIVCYHWLRVFGRNETLSLCIASWKETTRRKISCRVDYEHFITNHLFSLIMALSKNREMRERETHTHTNYLYSSSPLGCYSPGRLQGDRGRQWLTEVCNQDNQRQFQGKHSNYDMNSISQGTPGLIA